MQPKFDKELTFEKRERELDRFFGINARSWSPY
jgi:hypothetical protein